MAKMMSIIRYKYKADRDFESVQFEGTSCSLGELKRLIAEKSSRSATHHSRDDYDLIISNATTCEEYKDNSDLIPRNTSVVVARRIRGSFESLTPATNRKPVVSSDDIINDYLRPAILQTTSFPTSVVEGKGIPLEMLTQSTNTNVTEELSEDERIKQVIKISQARYLPAQRTTTSYTCHHCKQPGHLRNQCPVLLQSSSTGNTTGLLSSSTDGHTSKIDGSSSTNSNKTSYSSHIITNQAPYQISHHSHHHYNNNRSQHRPSAYVRHEPIMKKPTGIPRDDLISVPRHMPGAYTGHNGASVIPKPMGQLIIKESEKKADTLAQRNRQFQEKNVLSSVPSVSMLPTKLANEEQPPDDLLCPICKRVYTDAVITPCCHHSFCDACIRTALIESDEHECPHCHRQHVPIDHINPNLFLRNYVNRWHEERQQKSSYLSMSLPQQTSLTNSSTLLSSSVEQHSNSTLYKTSDTTNIQNSDIIDEYDIAVLPTTVQSSSTPIKTAPIVIRMQSTGQSSSPSQTMILTKPADVTFEDGKAPDSSDQITSSQKDSNSQSSTTNHNNDQNFINQTFNTTDSQIEKSDRETPPSQVAPLSTVLSSPSTTATMITETTSVVPHYYPPTPHILPHHGMIYPQQIPPTTAPDFYPIQPNFYSPTAHVPYPGGRHPVGPIIQHYPVHPLYRPVHHHPMGLPRVQSSLINGYHLGQYETGNISSFHQPTTIFSSTSVPQNVQTDPQTIPISTLSKEEFYKKQRDLQRINPTTNHRRSRSSSSSSYTSNDSRSSSFSRHDNQQQRRRSSRSRSRHEDNRKKSPNHRLIHRSSRDISKHRRSSSRYHSPTIHRDRTQVSSTKDEHSSHYRRSSSRSHRSIRDGERRRSPRPPPTIQQSIQRTIVYKHHSSSSKQHSNRDDHKIEHSSKHQSPIKEDSIAPLLKNDDQSQTELRLSVSPIPIPSDQKSTTLSSAIIAVTSSDNRSSNNIIKDKDLNNEKKRKKTHHYHHKKHHRHRSNSKTEKHYHSKTKDRTTHSVEVVQT